MPKGLVKCHGEICNWYGYRVADLALKRRVTNRRIIERVVNAAQADLGTGDFAEDDTNHALLHGPLPNEVVEEGFVARYLERREGWPREPQETVSRSLG